LKTVSQEWRQATFRLFIGNKKEDLTITNFSLTSTNFLVTTKEEEQLQTTIEPKKQIELRYFVSSQVSVSPQVDLSYQVGEKQSGQISLKLPVCAIHFSDPHAINAEYCKYLWGSWRNGVEAFFDLNLLKASNL